jgi:hypothetical protein
MMLTGALRPGMRLLQMLSLGLLTLWRLQAWVQWLQSEVKQDDFGQVDQE